MVDMTESLNIDFSEIADLGPVPVGQYEASIVSAKPGVSNSGYPKLDVAWKIEEGDFENRQIFDTFAFHPNALPITKRKLIELGFPDDFDGALDPEDFLGIHGTLVVVIQQSDQINEATGERYDPRNRVQRVLNGSGLDAVL